LFLLPWRDGSRFTSGGISRIGSTAGTTVGSSTTTTTPTAILGPLASTSTSRSTRIGTAAAAGRRARGSTTGTSTRTRGRTSPSSRLLRTPPSLYLLLLGSRLFCLAQFLLPFLLCLFFNETHFFSLCQPFGFFLVLELSIKSRSFHVTLLGNPQGRCELFILGSLPFGLRVRIIGVAWWLTSTGRTRFLVSSSRLPRFLTFSCQVPRLTTVVARSVVKTAINAASHHGSTSTTIWS
jgi:hypothetical protein